MGAKHLRKAAVTAEPSARSQTVLIVDDENNVRDLMSRWLESGGYSVITASNAEEALRRLETSKPAVALCDIRMPGHDGIWLAERIRQRYPETAVIMATGVQDVAPAVQTLRQGAIDYLTKPFGRDRLQEAVTRGLEWHRCAWDARRWRESLEQEMEIRRARLNDAITALGVDSDESLDAMVSMLMLTDREAYGGMVMPDRITLYRIPICAMCRTEEDVVEAVRDTVIHEVAHHFGIDDDRLDELGWA